MKKLKNIDNLTFVIFLAISLTLASSCGKEKTDPAGSSSFAQKKMLENYADNLIIPSYQAVANSIVDLQSAVTAFAQNYSTQNLQAVQQKWDVLYTDWQWANNYNFGPAGEQGVKKRLVEEMGTFPVDTSGVNTKMISLDTTFSDFKRDTRGLLAIEYLVFDAQQTAAQIIAKYQADANRIAYLKALANKLDAQLNQVLIQWKNGYRESFVDNTGTSVGSSVSMLYNEFVRGYESVKNFKLGIPLGKKAGQTAAEPNKVEALFSEKSLSYLKENIKSVENNWDGKSRIGSDAKGWKEYLESVTGGEALVVETKTQQANITQTLGIVSSSSSLQSQIGTNFSTLDNLYTELQKQTRFYKSDMSSLLGIAITFTDADGD